jgi:hypothetical protein
MPFYRFGDCVVTSDIVLNLPAGADPPADIEVEIGPIAAETDRPSRPFFQHVQPDGTVWVAFSHTADGVRAHFPDMADFVIAAAGRLVRCAPEPGLPPDTLEHLLLDQILPRALSHQGRIVLHAAAVAIDGRAAVFLGDTGRGKSTLVRYLIGTGLPLVSDDCLILTAAGDPVMGIGSYPGLRLWPDSVRALEAGADQSGGVAHYSRKRRIAMPPTVRFQTTPLPLAQLFLLAPPAPDDEAIAIVPVPARERVVHLHEYSFRLDVTDRVRSAREFAALADLAERLPLAWLRYPRRYERLPEVAAAVRAHLTGIRHPDAQST